MYKNILLFMDDPLVMFSRYVMKAVKNAQGLEYMI